MFLCNRRHDILYKGTVSGAVNIYDMHKLVIHRDINLRVIPTLGILQMSNFKKTIDLRELSRKGKFILAGNITCTV